MRKATLLLFWVVLLLWCGQASSYEIKIAADLPIDSELSNVAVDPQRGITVAVNATSKMLYVVNIETKKIIHQISLDLAPSEVVLDRKRNGAFLVSREGTFSFVSLTKSVVLYAGTIGKKISSVAISEEEDVALIGTDAGFVKLSLETGLVVAEVPLPVRTAIITVNKDDALVFGTDAASGLPKLILVDIPSGIIQAETGLKTEELAGLSVDTDRGLIIMGGKDGRISLIDSHLIQIAEMNACSSVPSCSIAGFAYNALTHTTLLSDAINNRLVLANTETRSVLAELGGYTGLGRIAVDPTRNIAVVIHGKGLLFIKPENPLPQINTLVPKSARSGDAGILLSVEGENFIRDSKTQFNTSPIDTFFKDDKSLQASIPAERLTTPGEVPVTVTNPPPGGGESNVCTFKVYNPAPVLATITPNAVAKGTSVTLKVKGRNFFNGSKVNLNGEDLRTRFISSILLEAEVGQTLTGKTGQYTVVVINPSPGGFTSNPRSLTVVERDDPLIQSDKTAAQQKGPEGTGSLKGRIVNTHLEPLNGVSIKAKNLSTETDGDGEFLLEGIPAGKRVILIDGSTERGLDNHYPTIPLTVDIEPGIVNDMPFQVYLHKQKDRNFQQIDPATDTILTDPEVPGFEMRIPKGVNITGWDGKINSKVSVRTVPADRLPVKPLPKNAFMRTVYMFYFNKIGGGSPDRPIPVKYPNDLGLLPGEKAIIWYYDESPVEGEAPNDWAIAGTGTVSPDGRYIISDPGVGIPKFCCGATGPGCAGACPSGPGPDQCPK